MRTILFECEVRITNAQAEKLEANPKMVYGNQPLAQVFGKDIVIKRARLLAKQND